MFLELVSIVTSYGLDDPGIESWWGGQFSSPVQTGPGSHPASYTMGTRFFFHRGKAAKLGFTTHPIQLRG